MKGGEHYVRGELYLSLETFAETYAIRVVWLREVFEFGLLGEGVPRGDTVCIAAHQMERVASIIRLHDLLGVPLESILGILEPGTSAVGE